MKKRYFFVVAILFFVCATSVFAEEPAPDYFKNPNQIVKEIKNYYQEVLGKLTVKIYLLDIFVSEEDRNIIEVFFLENRDPSIVKDMFTNRINSKKVPVMVARYFHSKLRYTWHLRRIERLTYGMTFKVDNHIVEGGYF